MNYVKVSFPDIKEELAEMVIASLSDIGFDGFEETDKHLAAFIAEDKWDETELVSIVTQYAIDYVIEQVENENWNAKWESSFEPVIVGDFCAVRADFHKQVDGVQYEIVITPKMSFGTGHHATTQLMIEYMSSIDFKQKTVLDFGTGTGVLAILAEMLGADNITAIDNDEWSYENTIENCERNNSSKITTYHATLDREYGNKYNVILANINRNILLQYMTEMYAMLTDEGVLLLSGIMPEDKEVILNAADEAGFFQSEFKEMGNWVAVKTYK